jgi:hypothetical protein
MCYHRNVVRIYDLVTDHTASSELHMTEWSVRGVRER